MYLGLPLAAGLGGSTGITGSHEARGGYEGAAGERRADGLGDGCAEHDGLYLVNCLVRCEFQWKSKMGAIALLYPYYSWRAGWRTLFSIGLGCL